MRRESIDREAMDDSTSNPIRPANRSASNTPGPRSLLRPMVPLTGREQRKRPRDPYSLEHQGVLIPVPFNRRIESSAIVPSDNEESLLRGRTAAPELRQLVITIDGHTSLLEAIHQKIDSQDVSLEEHQRRLTAAIDDDAKRMMELHTEVSVLQDGIKRMQEDLERTRTQQQSIINELASTMKSMERTYTELRSEVRECVQCTSKVQGKMELLASQSNAGGSAAAPKPADSVMPAFGAKPAAPTVPLQMNNGVAPVKAEPTTNFSFAPPPPPPVSAAPASEAPVKSESTTTFAFGAAPASTTMASNPFNLSSATNSSGGSSTSPNANTMGGSLPEVKADAGAGFGASSTTTVMKQELGGSPTATQPMAVESEAKSSTFSFGTAPATSAPPQNPFAMQSASATPAVAAPEQQQPPAAPFSFGGATSAVPSLSPFRPGAADPASASTAPTNPFHPAGAAPAPAAAMTFGAAPAAPTSSSFGAPTAPSATTTFGSATPAFGGGSTAFGAPSAGNTTFGAANNANTGAFGGASASPPPFGQAPPSFSQPLSSTPAFGAPAPNAGGGILGKSKRKASRY